MQLQPSITPPPVTDREEIAKREIGVTAVSPALAWFLMIAFLLAIGIVPLFEWARTRGSGGAASAWSHLAELRDRIPATFADTGTPEAPAGWWSRTVAVNREILAAFTAFESALEDQSHLGRLLRPPAQWVLSGWLGAGNERAYVGREGWLFYRPDVEYVTNAGFLLPSQLERRRTTASEWERPPQADPRPAILRFNQQLKARGIALIVMPTPVKPTIHPAWLARGRVRPVAPVQNLSFDEFVADLRRHGVLVFDPSAALVRAALELGQPQYLATDTHWRPEGVEVAALGLREFIDANVPLPAVADPFYKRERVATHNIGDIAVMLDLPSGQTRFPPETVLIRRIQAHDGTPWQPARDADVLVLGDSFSNIYSLASMNWGESAGFVEQLSYVLKRPVDRLVQNDDGAFATRALLRRSVSGDGGRLTGKRVVVYQFAARELAFGDWQIIDIPND
jgi:SGNH hydrolase-like domain, acetyltransferase AlgX